MFSTGIKLYIMESKGTTALMLYPALGWTLLDLIDLHVSDDYKRAFGESEAQGEHDRVVTLVGQPRGGLGDDSYSDGDEYLILAGIVSESLDPEKNWSKAKVEWSLSATETLNMDVNYGYIDLGALTLRAQEIARYIRRRKDSGMFDEILAIEADEAAPRARAWSDGATVYLDDARVGPGASSVLNVVLHNENIDLMLAGDVAEDGRYQAAKMRAGKLAARWRKLSFAEALAELEAL